MRRTRHSASAWVLSVATGAALLIFTFARAGEDKATITAEDLATGKVVVIGRLGLPLRTMMTIRGTWRYPDQSQGATKDYSLGLHVTHVDDKPLGAPVEFDMGGVRVRSRAGFGNSERSPSAVDGPNWKCVLTRPDAFPGRLWPIGASWAPYSLRPLQALHS